MVRSSFNSQYQSTGVGSLSLLVEIEPIQSIRGVFSCNRQFPMDVLVKNAFMANSDKTSRCLYEQNKSNETIQSLLINTVAAYMPIDEMPIVRLFISS